MCLLIIVSVWRPEDNLQEVLLSFHLRTELRLMACLLPTESSSVEMAL